MQINRYTREVMTERKVANLVNPQAIGQAGEALSVAADLTGQIAKKMGDSTDSMWFTETLARKTKTRIDMEQQERLKFTDNPEGYSGYFDKKMVEFDDEVIKTAPSENAREMYRQAALKDNISIYENNKNWETKARIESIKAKGKKANDLGNESAYTLGANGQPLDPEIINQNTAAAIGLNSVMSPEQVAEYEAATRKEKYDKYVQGLAKSNPDKAVKELENYKAITESVTFDDAVRSIFDLEGGYVENDAGQGPTIYGVNSASNPKEFAEIMRLEQEGKPELAKEIAKQTYKTKYWDAINADKLDPRLAYVAVDSAVNMGVGATKEMLSQANGDIGKFLDLRRSRYQSIAANNPEKEPYLKGWLNRVDMLEDRLDGGVLPQERIDELGNLAFKQSEFLKTQQEAKLEETRSVDDSRIELAMAQMQSPSDSAVISDSIDEMQAIYGEAWANGKREKLVKASDEFIKKSQSISIGAAFASGQASYNPANNDHKKALNDFYQGYVSSPEFQQMPPEERNVVLSDMIRKAGAVPDYLKGEIKSVSMSQDVEKIKNVADLVDRITSTNPHLLPQFGSETELRRIDMINDRVNAGYQPQDAMKVVDEILDPRNAPTQEQIKTELAAWKKAKPTYYADRIDAVFNPWFGGLDKSAIAKSSIDAATAEYRVRWEDAYAKTRDVTQATKEADRMLTDWSISAVNPNNMVMKFSPEKYYNIENVSPQWIRDQAIQDSLGIENKVFEYSKDDLENNLYIVSDPNLTPRTASTGSPQYRLIVLKDGIAYPLSDKPWSPDKEKKAKELIEKAVLEKEKIKQKNAQYVYSKGGRYADMGKRNKDK